MKKYIILLVSLFIIAGCGTENESKVEPKTDTEEVNYLGIKYSLTAETSRSKRIDGIYDNSLLDKMYPFNEIKLVNIKKTDSGKTKLTYADDEKFTRDGSNGQVMVEIPKHYFQRYQEDDQEFIKISRDQEEGFELDPAFIEDGKELEAIYVSAYDGHLKDNKLNSWSGVFPSENISLNGFREYAENNGEGFGLLDYRTVAMLQRLFMVYTADRDSQTAIGKGKTELIHKSSDAGLALNTTYGDYIEIKSTKNSKKSFLVGDTITVSNAAGEAKNREITKIKEKEGIQTINFDGEFAYINEGNTKIYHAPQRNGETDEITEHSGSSRVFEQAGHDSVKLFHIENLWGNVWTLLDGVLLDDLNVWIGENQKDYQTYNYKDNYLKLADKYPHQALSKPKKDNPYEFFIKNLAYDDKHPAYQLPIELETSNADKHFSDQWYAYNEPDKVATFGGSWDLSDKAGIFTTRFWEDPMAGKDYNGARLIYKDY